MFEPVPARLGVRMKRSDRKYVMMDNCCAAALEKTSVGQEPVAMQITEAAEKIDIVKDNDAEPGVPCYANPLRTSAVYLLRIE